MNVVKIKVTTLTPFFSGETRKEVRQAAYDVSKKIPIRTNTKGHVILNWKAYIRMAYQSVFPDESDKDLNSDYVKIFGTFNRQSYIMVNFLTSKLNQQKISKLTFHLNSKTSNLFSNDEVIEGSVFESSIQFQSEEHKIKYFPKIRKALEYISGPNGSGIGAGRSRGYGKVLIEIFENDSNE